MVSTLPISEKLFIGGDLNGHVGATNVGFERVHGPVLDMVAGVKRGGGFELRVGLRLVDSEYPF